MCEFCPKQTLRVKMLQHVTAMRVLLEGPAPPDMDLVRQVVYQTKKAIQAGRTRFSFSYHGHGGVVEISPTGNGSK